MEARNVSEKPPSSKIFVLCVDDEPNLLELTKIFLEKEDDRLSVDTSTSTEEALKYLETKTYEAIVCDYQMPGMNGLEFLESLRNQNNLIPFIILTGKSREEVAIRALNLGADRYLQKGGDPKTLYGVLAQAIIQEVSHKRAENDLLFINSLLKAQYETSIDGILVVDGTGQLIFHNKRFKEMWGIPQDILDSKDAKKIQSHILGQLKDPDEFSRRIEYLNVHTNEESKEEIEFLDGRIFDQYSSPLIYEKRNLYGRIWYFRDITGRKRADMALEETKNKYQMLIEKLEEGLTLEDPEGFITFVNPKTLETLGYTEDEIIGKHWSFIVPEEEREKSFIETAERPKGISSTYESKVLAKDGSIIPVIVSASPIFSSTGEFQGVIVLSTNITERKQAERALRQSEERERFFLTLLRHDLKNKIYIIRGYLDLLLHSDLSDENRKLIEKALITSEKSHQLLEKIGRLRDIDQEDEVIVVNLHVILKDVIKKNQDKIEENKNTVEYEATSYEVLGGPLLEELFNNIIENSIKHAECNKIKISCHEINRGIVTIFEDDGKGIPKQIVDDILNRGHIGEDSMDTGIGLLLIKLITERYGGTIAIKDTKLGGVRIDVELKKA